MLSLELDIAVLFPKLAICAASRTSRLSSAGPRYSRSVILASSFDKLNLLILVRANSRHRLDANPTATSDGREKCDTHSELH